MSNEFSHLNTVMHGDCREKMGLIPDDYVAVSVWSPPYFVGKKYEEYINNFDEWKELISVAISKHYRIIKPGGYVVINIGDILCYEDSSIPKFQTNVITGKKQKVTKEDIEKAQEENPTFSRYELADLLNCSEQTIQRRLEGVNVRGGKYANETKVKQISGLIEEWAEDAGFFIKDSRHWIKDAAWANSKWVGSQFKAVDEIEHIFFLWKPGETVYDRNRLTKEEWTEWGDRQRWHMKSVRANDDHEAKFPIELPRRVIKMLTNRGDVVLDPFIGSGTTGCAAKELGRNWIGIEREKDYCDLTTQNVSSTKYSELTGSFQSRLDV